VQALHNGVQIFPAMLGDDRSFRLNQETNLNTYDAAFAREQMEVFESDKRRSRMMTRLRRLSSGGRALLSRFEAMCHGACTFRRSSAGTSRARARSSHSDAALLTRRHTKRGRR
jgi:phosphatidylserine/phosphatidylglycerophosphate/cardiolipin synthase-like enzyme